MTSSIAKLALHSSSTNTSTYTIPASSSFTPTAGDVLVVFGIIGGSVDTAPTCAASANNMTFTRVAADPHTLQGSVTVLFVSNEKVPTSPAAMTTTITLPTDAGTSALLYVGSVSNCVSAGSAAIRSVSGTPQVGKHLNITAGGTWDVTLPAAPLSTNPILGFIGTPGGHVGTAPGVSPPTGFTEVEEPADQSAAVIGIEFCKAESGISSAGPHNFTSSVTRTRANAYLVEFETGGVAAGSWSFAGAAAGIATPVATFHDDFTTYDSAVWTTVSGTFTITSGALDCTTSSGTAETKSRVIATSGKVASVKLVRKSTGTAGQTEVRIYVAATYLIGLAMTENADGTVTYVRRWNNGGTENAALCGQNITAGEDYLRIRLDSGVAYFETSANGSSWNTRANSTGSTLPDTSIARLRLLGGLSTNAPRVDWVDLAVASSTPTGSGTGDWSFAGSAAGTKAPVGTGTGTWSFAGTTAAKTTHSGTATGSWSFAGAASGAVPKRGSATGSWSFAGTAVGARTPKGIGSSSWSFAGTAAGSRTPKASSTGSWSFTGTASGARTPKASSTGSWSFAGTAAGSRTPKATGTGSWSFEGAAVGSAPAVGMKTGSATGDWAFTGTAAGLITHQGSSTGSWAFASTASGVSHPIGSATGDTTWTGVAVGIKHPVGSSTGTWTWEGAAVGVQPAQVPEGAATGSWTFHGAGEGWTTSSLTQVLNLMVLQISGSELDLSWDAVSNALFYEIERDGVLIDTSRTTSYQDLGLDPGVEYAYRVRAGG